ncbi:MAG: hypothetical protein ACREJ5_01070 [Geminicoccaceae bacterium]
MTTLRRFICSGGERASTLGAFVTDQVVVGSTVASDGWSGYARPQEVKHAPKILGRVGAHIVLP